MPSKTRKVAIVGVGAVGASCAYALVNQSICDEIVLIGRSAEKVRADALDLSHCMDFTHNRTKVGTGTYEDCRDADIVVLSAGVVMIPGGTRLDLAASSLEICREIVPQIVAAGFEGVFLVAANPVDVVTGIVLKLSGFPRSRVIGTGTSIDSARLKTLLAEHLPVDPRSINGYVLGEHGDSQFPAWSHVTIGGKPIRDILAQHGERFDRLDLDVIAQQTRNAGWEILQAKGATTYGIASALASIARSILNNEHRIVAVSAYLEGEYGQSGLCAGVPAILTREGMTEIVELNLTAGERRRFAESCGVIRGAMEALALDAIAQS
ncbi:L-lactate dehydrogenase [Paenibacillus sp. UNC496MF]|uniref:L-lactate dehydrogenase n=1 Tax=Paenibacillus sp. UNC496MF TaxID=1502753 RepID=UPI0008E0C73A|nr:L-lactate dehydrogenase [Paenibacillus sp. UNC496MF]SFJ21299.1 L-lactate dehydrogenase [Paenibacillus sp. UNC496MF]